MPLYCTECSSQKNQTKKKCCDKNRLQPNRKAVSAFTSPDSQDCQPLSCNFWNIVNKQAASYSFWLLGVVLWRVWIDLLHYATKENNSWAMFSLPCAPKCNGPTLGTLATKNKQKIYLQTGAKAMYLAFAWVNVYILLCFCKQHIDQPTSL